MTPLQACLVRADEQIGKNRKSLFDPVRVYVETAEGHELRRVFILTDAAVRTITPMALERDQAAILRALPEIVDVETARGAADAAAYAANYGAYNAAAGYAAAGYAAAGYAAASADAYAAANAYWAARHAASAAYEAAYATKDDRPWLALRDAMLRAACLDGACCIHPDCRGEEPGSELAYPELGRMCLIEADPLGVRKNPTEMSTGTAALAGAAVGAVLGELVYMLRPKA